MNWLAIALRSFGGLCLLAVLLGALRGVLEAPRFMFLRKFDETTKYPYFGLAALGIGLLIVGFFPDAQVRSVDAWGFKAELQRLDTKVETLSQQMEAFFKQKRTEVFTQRDPSWSRVKLLKQVVRPHSLGFWIYDLEVTLEREPYEGSVDVLYGGVMPVHDFELHGKKLTFPIETGEPYDELAEIRVTYYPRAAQIAK